MVSGPASPGVGFEEHQLHAPMSLLFHPHMPHCAGIEAVTRVMETWGKHEGVQCNCCLALMALVRGTGSVCQVSPVPTALQNMYISQGELGQGGGVMLDYTLFRGTVVQSHCFCLSV